LLRENGFDTTGTASQTDEQSLPKEAGIMVIFEGPDGAGKTTLMKQLTAEGGPLDPERYRVFDRNRGNRETLADSVRRDYQVAFGHTVSNPPRIPVFDRLYYSELAYSNCLRRECQLTVPEVRMYQGILTHLPALVFICLPHVDELILSGQPQPVKDNIQQIWDWYKALSMGYIIPTTDFMVTINPFVASAIDESAHEIRNWEEACRVMRNL
jgi:energy-coupling factor transporter ATP-binding protein EcfA2